MRNRINNSRLVMAVTITMGLAIAGGTPTFAGAGCTQLRGTATSLARSVPPPMPSPPVRIKAGEINDGRQGRSMSAYDVYGSVRGVVQRVTRAIRY